MHRRTGLPPRRYLRDGAVYDRARVTGGRSVEATSLWRRRPHHHRATAFSLSDVESRGSVAARADREETRRSNHSGRRRGPRDCFAGRVPDRPTAPWSRSGLRHGDSAQPGDPGLSSGAHDWGPAVRMKVKRGLTGLALPHDRVCGPPGDDRKPTDTERALRPAMLIRKDLQLADRAGCTPSPDPAVGRAADRGDVQDCSAGRGRCPRPATWRPGHRGAVTRGIRCLPASGGPLVPARHGQMKRADGGESPAIRRDIAPILTRICLTVDNAELSYPTRI